MILFFARPQLTYHVCVGLTLAKLYTNSLLGLLNSRIHITGGRNTSNQEEDRYLSVGAVKRQSTVTPQALNLHAIQAAHSLGGGSVEEQKWTESRMEDVPLDDQVRSLL